MNPSFVFGFHPTREALRRRPGSVAEVLISARDGGRRREIEALCADLDVPLRHVTNAQLDVRGSGTHNGFGAELRPEAEGDAGAASGPEIVLLLEDIQDPRNLGAILRVAEGAGVSRVLIRDRGSAPLTAAAVKTSAGAAEWVEVERIGSPADRLEQYKAKGFWVYGADAAGEAPWTVDLDGPLVLCMGGEEKGLRRRTREACDGLLGLPMQGRIESLNVATATSALLFEVVRQRTKAGS